MIDYILNQMDREIALQEVIQLSYLFVYKVDQYNNELVFTANSEVCVTTYRFSISEFKKAVVDKFINYNGTLRYTREDIYRNAVVEFETEKARILVAIPKMEPITLQFKKDIRRMYYERNY